MTTALTGAERAALDAVEAALGGRARRDEPVGVRTTYRVGGHATLALDVDGAGDLITVARALDGTAVPLLVVGKGSNLLVADRGFDGLVLFVGDGLASITVEAEASRVEAGAGVSLPVLARRTAAAALTGLEWAVGVPGSVGGAVRMNAGGHGSDMAASVESAAVVDLFSGSEAEAVHRPAAALGFGYRRSALRPGEVVVGARFALSTGDRTESEAAVADIVRWRREHQPGGQNAGSVFTNPPGDSAGRLIEAAGMKGHRVGSAHVSPKHANFFQSDPAGSADDVRRLIEEVQAMVEKRTGVRLDPELRMVGFPGSSGEPVR